MESQLSTLWRVLLWGLGTCVTGFLFLAGWLWFIVREQQKRITYTWFEEVFQTDMNKRLDKINDTVNGIKDALIGDFTNKGIITKVSETTKEIELIKLKCEKNHSDTV